ncbi:MAG: HD-GYP domain-containing protein [Syntrophomonadaceae bacterium]|jgi:HD-GYP domain-containing protein (c-di-GMP phosphodiesterase class II)|nr:HD-GYP domain-containing protein [Syntrophomonadaceae bacterium]
MRRVSLEYLEPGMKIGRTIYSTDGRPLLVAGMVLNTHYIKRLIDYGIGSVFIKDDMFDEIEEPPDLISEQTRLESVRTVKELFHNLESKKRINLQGVKKTVKNLIDEVLSNREILVNFADIRNFDDYTFSHSVQVCVLSIITGISLGLDHIKLKDLATGALIHDIGKTRVDRELLNKPGDLTTEEFIEIKRHAERGFEILRANQDISLLSAHIAYQHHERWDGNGYPRGLREQEIHLYSRIVAVADVFDALVADRPYRKAYSTSQAISLMRRMSGSQFDPGILESFLVNVAEFPIGTVVALSSGEIGVVVDTNREKPILPVVRVIFSKRLKPLSVVKEIDLTKDASVHISRVLGEEEVSRLFKGLLSVKQVVNSN